MKRLMLLLLLLLVPMASAQTLFMHYEPQVFTASLVFGYGLESPFIKVVEATKPVDIKEAPTSEVAKNKEHKISITTKGFDPKIVEIDVGDTVTWVNNMKLESVIHGVQELNELKSGKVLPGEEFSWTFEEKGTYQYVDTIIIGSVGKVNVR